MLTAERELERITRVSPFGFKLWDAFLGRAISDRLSVTARDRTGRERAVLAGPGGVFTIRDLPIASPFVGGAGDDPFWADPPPLGTTWVIEVVDPASRYLPFRFQADGAMRVGPVARDVCRLPPQGAAAELDAADPGARTMPILPLFPSPAYPITANAAAVEADLATTSGSDPAGTLVQVSIPDGPTAFGMADRHGSVRVVLPYPPPAADGGAPPTPPRQPIADQRWTGVIVHAFRDPALVDPGLPDLCSVLDQFGAAPVPILASAPPSGPLGALTLEFGRPLVVRTAGRPAALLDTGAPPQP
jgi:hypothetical protein